MFKINPPKSIKVFFAANLSVCILYRILFFTYAYHPSLKSLLIMMGLSFFSDFLAISFLSLLLIAVYKSLFFFIIKNTRVRQYLDYFFNIFIFFIFVLITLVYLANKKIYFLLFMGLNYTILASYLN